MSQFRSDDVSRPQQRRWSFANCIFDESNWALTVGGRRAPVEIKPLQLLRALLMRAGNVVTKSELLDAVWPNVEVVEASLTTAVRKLRTALDDDKRKVHIIETVPRIGYRLAVPVHLDDAVPEPGNIRLTPAPREPSQPALPIAAMAGSFASRHRLAPRLLSVGGGMAILLAATAGVMAPSQNVRATQTAAVKAEPGFTQKDVEKAIRMLDVTAIETLVAAGWNPAQRWDKQGTDALGMLLNHCEWDRGHDRRQMLLMARTLVEAGAPIDRRNIFGDTAYSIAKAPRYCGPDHPVTQMLEAICYGGDMGPKDRCLATYELNSAQRRQQGLPPKA